MVDLVRAGRDPTDLAREFEPSRQTIQNWVTEADRGEGRSEAKPPMVDPGLTTTERDELVRLRRENRQLKLEREPKVSEAISSRARLPDHGDGPCAWRVEGRGLRLDPPGALGEGDGGRRAAEADPHRPLRLARDLWRAARPRRPTRAGRAAFSQIHRSADARGRPRRGQPSARRSRDHTARSGGAPGPRPRRSQLRGRGTEPAVGGRHHLRANCTASSTLPWYSMPSAGGSSVGR